MMAELKYSPVPRRDREAIVAGLSSGRPKEIAAALLSAAYWESDWKWAQEQLLRFASHDDPAVLCTVASGFGLLAAFHGNIDEQTVGPILSAMAADGTVRGLADTARNSLDEIEHFVRRRRAGEDIDLAERMPENWRPT